jgi:hypothetical protein
MVTKLTSQEVFDKSATGLMIQGERAEDESRACVYRGLDNTKCAAGFLILDEFYSQEMETAAVVWDTNSHSYNEKSSTRVREALVNSGVELEDLKLVNKLQRIHDSSDCTKWAEDLANLASDFDLEFTDPKAQVEVIL